MVASFGMDQIWLSWRDFFKLLLEIVSFIFAFGPLVYFYRFNGLSTTITVTPVFIFLFVVSLVIMRIVEKEMYEVSRGMRKGKIWFNLR